MAENKRIQQIRCIKYENIVNKMQRIKVDSKSSAENMRIK